MPVLHAVSKDTRIIAIESDIKMSAQKETNDSLRDTERVMKKAFKYTIEDRYLSCDAILLLGLMFFICFTGSKI